MKSQPQILQSEPGQLSSDCWVLLLTASIAPPTLTLISYKGNNLATLGRQTNTLDFSPVIGQNKAEDRGVARKTLQSPTRP